MQQEEDTSAASPGSQWDKQAGRQADRDRGQRDRLSVTGRRYLGRLLQDDNGTGHSGQHPAVASSPRGGHADHRSLHQDVLVDLKLHLTKFLGGTVVLQCVGFHRLPLKVLQRSSTHQQATKCWILICFWLSNFCVCCFRIINSVLFNFSCVRISTTLKTKLLC